MQFKILTLTALVGLAATATSSSVSSLASDIPSCATSCLDQGAAAADCGTTDYSCQCENQATISSNASSCLASSCSVSDISSKFHPWPLVSSKKPGRKKKKKEKKQL